MFARLDWYIARSFLSSYFVALLFLVGLFLVTDGVTKVDDMLKAREGLEEAGVEIAFAPLVVRYFLLQVPLVFLTMGPFITLFAGIFTVVRLQRANELAPILCAGRSLQRAMYPVLFCGLLAAGSMIALREGFLPAIADQRDRVEAVILDKMPSYQIDNFMFRDAPDVFVSIKSFDPGAGRIDGLKVSRRLPDGYSLELDADVAQWEESAESGAGWNLRHLVGVGEEARLEPGGEVAVEEGGEYLDDGEVPERIGAALQGKARERWRVRFRPGDIPLVQRLRTNPLELNRSNIRRLGRFYPGDHRLETLALYAFTFPAANLILLLLGLPFCMHLERRGVAEGLARGLFLCVIYFCADFVLRDLGTRHVLHPLFACCLPLVLFGSLGAARFASMRS